MTLVLYLSNVNIKYTNGSVELTLQELAFKNTLKSGFIFFFLIWFSLCTKTSKSTLNLLKANKTEKKLLEKVLKVQINNYFYGCCKFSRILG